MPYYDLVVYNGAINIVLIDLLVFQIVVLRCYRGASVRVCHMGYVRVCHMGYI